MQNYTFQVNLGGIIDILANHLYSDESVFIRELLQNATDAITACVKKGKSFTPRIEVEVVSHRDSPSQLLISDNGIGLTEQEVHQFLSVIGASSKKDELLKKREDFIGQFGIGLLSCFVAADEIVLITKSQSGEPAVEWIGKSDGTYSIRQLESAIEAGTRVYLTAKPAMESYFRKDIILELIHKYADFLPYPIFLVDNGKKAVRVNSSIFPWEEKFNSEADKKNALLDFAREYFEDEFIDCIPLRSSASQSEGYAFISLRSYPMHQEQQHSIYLHRMFLSGKASNVLPEWLFFAKCMINSKALRPTASRETFYEDDILKATREELGRCIIQYLYSLERKDPQLLAQIILTHHTAIKLAAISNDDFFEKIHPFIPFETSVKTKPLSELLKNNEPIRYVTDIDEYRKIAGVALNQSIEIVNAGYVYEPAFFEKLIEFYPDREISFYDVEELMQQLEELSLDEREKFFGFLKMADVVLREFRCSAEMKKFLPKAMPAIYFKNEEMDYIRNIDKSKEVADELWSGILDNMSQQAARDAYAILCFNYNNSLVQKMASIKNKENLAVLIRMLYVQSLLLGRHALQSAELNLLTGGLTFLLEKLTDEDGKH